MTLAGAIILGVFSGVAIISILATIRGQVREARAIKRYELAARAKRFLRQEHREHHNSQTSGGKFTWK